MKKNLSIKINSLIRQSVISPRALSDPIDTFLEVKKMKNLFKFVSDNTPLHMSGAFIAMGGWAFFANRIHPLEVAAVSAVTQGALSATITFGLKRALEAVSTAFMIRHWRWVALFAPPLIVCSFSLAVLVVVHMQIRTPELIATISIPFGVAFTYACLYNLRLWTKPV